MSLFQTTDAQKVNLYKLAIQMKEEGLSDKFIVDVVEIASYYEGIYDMIELWAYETDREFRNDIIADLQDEIEEFKEQPKEPLKKPYIKFSDLDLVAKNTLAFKAHLKTLVDKWGGVTKLSKETGIPQPSLSRFFSSASMPRRTTLYKIAEALNLSEKEIFTDWAA